MSNNIEKVEKREVSIRTQEGLVAEAMNYVTQYGEAKLPKNYDAVSAVKSLYLHLKDITKDKQNRPALEVATPESIQATVHEYISKGLNVAKKQAYPIVYGNKLQLQVGYFGNAKQARSEAGIKINSKVIREGDDVEIVMREDGTFIIKHKTSFKNILNGKLQGAYAVAVDIRTGEVVDSDIMGMEEIKTSWSKSSSYQQTVHKEFPGEMARKTVISRLAKPFINTSDDSLKFEDLQTDVEIDKEDIYADKVMTVKKGKDEEKSEKAEDDVVIITELEKLDELEPVAEEKAKATAKKTTTTKKTTATKKSDDIVEVFYSEFKNNPEKYNAIPDSYDKEKKTIKVRKK